MSESRILICAATGTEASACAAGVRKAAEEKKELKDRFEILKTGIGAVRAAEALDRRLQSGPKPRLIISSGFAGSWSDRLDVGQWISAERVASDQENIALDRVGRDSHLENQRHEPKFKNDDSILPLTRFDFVQSATVYSASKIHENPPRFLLENLGAGLIAVDMESFALAQVAFRHQISFGILRYITDSPNQALPSFVRHFTDVATQKNSGPRVEALFNGAKALLAESAKIAPFLKNGNRWRSALIEGWAGFAGHF